MELRRREEIRTFNEQQESAFIHQKFSRIIITKLKPILADIIRQGCGKAASSAASRKRQPKSC